MQYLIGPENVFHVSNCLYRYLALSQTIRSILLSHVYGCFRLRHLMLFTTQVQVYRQYMLLHMVTHQRQPQGKMCNAYCFVRNTNQSHTYLVFKICALQLYTPIFSLLLLVKLVTLHSGQSQSRHLLVNDVVVDDGSSNSWNAHLITFSGNCEVVFLMRTFLYDEAKYLI